MSALSTRLAIVSALDELMTKRPLADVTVASVCETAGVARSTFYRYFHDVPAVAWWVWDRANQNGIYQEGRTLTCYDAHLRTFEELRRYRRFFNGAFKQVNYSSVTQYGGAKMHRYLIAVFEHKAKRQLNQQEALLLEFYVSGAKHMTRHWASRDMVDEPPVMAATFATSMPGFMVPYLSPDPSCKIDMERLLEE